MCHTIYPLCSVLRLAYLWGERQVAGKTGVLAFYLSTLLSYYKGHSCTSIILSATFDGEIFKLYPRCLKYLQKASGYMCLFNLSA